jgi:hypothetical protein
MEIKAISRRGILRIAVILLIPAFVLIAWLRYQVEEAKQVPAQPPIFATPKNWSMEPFASWPKFLWSGNTSGWGAFFPFDGRPGTAWEPGVSITAKETVEWSFAWCAQTREILTGNLEHIDLQFFVDEQEIPSDAFQVEEIPYSYSEPAALCSGVFVDLIEWSVGKHKLRLIVTFTSDIDTGHAQYTAGDYIIDSGVNVEP